MKTDSAYKLQNTRIIQNTDKHGHKETQKNSDSGTKLKY